MTSLETILEDDWYKYTSDSLPNVISNYQHFIGTVRRPYSCLLSDQDIRSSSRHVLRTTSEDVVGVTYHANPVQGGHRDLLWIVDILCVLIDKASNH